MYDTDEETEADQYSSQLCLVRSDPTTGGAVQVLQATAEHLLEQLEILFHSERIAFETAVRIAYYKFPEPSDRTNLQNDMVQLLIQEGILLCEQFMEQDVRYIIYAAVGGWEDPPRLKYTELHEILAD